MITHIILDWDGTIADSEGLRYESNRIVFEKLGIDLSVEEYYKRWCIEGTCTRGMIKDYGIQKPLDEIRKEKKQIFLELCKDLRLNKGVLEFLENYQNLHPLPIVTAAGRSTVEPFVEKLGLGGKVKVIVAGCEIDKVKPHPEPYLKATEILGIKPENCLVIEDSVAGVNAAKAAGMRCIAIPNQYTDKSLLKDADKIVSSFKEITPEVIQNVHTQYKSGAAEDRSS